MVRVINKKMGGGIKNRLGQKFGTQQTTMASAGDARLRIIAKKRSTIVDARDRLTTLAKTMDARQKLQKIRNLKQGKLDVKTTAKGGITITTRTNGTLQLTTAKKAAGAKKTGNQKNRLANKAVQGLASGNRSSLQSKQNRNTGVATKKSLLALKRNQTGRNLAESRAGQGRAGITKASQNVQQIFAPQLSRTLMSDAAILDEELMATHIDPLILKRTIRQQIQRAPEAFEYDRRPLYTVKRGTEHDVFERRPLPPSFTTVPPSSVGRRYDYDDIRQQEREDEMYRKRMLLGQQVATQQLLSSRTMADRVAESGGSFSSPLQGTKVVVSNLMSTVSYNDIMELFGDIGPLKRVKITSPGTAEVVYVNKSDATKAVEIYHSRLLDGKAMKCEIVGNISPFESSPPAVSFPRSAPSHVTLAPDISAIQNALFVGRAGQTGSMNRPMFTVTMPTKGTARF